MREIIKEWLKKLEFMTGLKQFREMPLDDARMLIDCLEEKVKSYPWMNEFRLNEIFKKGMEGGYGDFYGINVKTISIWCNTYQEHHKQLLLIEGFNKGEEEVKSQEEIDYWINRGREMFIECWEKAKNGEIRPLAEWIPTRYQFFVDKGLLDESNYRFDEKYEKKMLRVEKGFAFSTSTLVSRKKQTIWKQFIQDMINQKIDLTKFI